MQQFPINLKRVAVFGGIIILMLMMMDLNKRLDNLNQLSDELQDIRGEATRAVQTQLGLQTKVAYATSNEAVEDFARSEGHYIKDGDQAVVPLDVPGAEAIIESAPTPMPTPMQNWEVWWALFFGEK